MFEVLEFLFAQGKNGTVLGSRLLDHGNFSSLTERQFVPVITLERVDKSIDIIKHVFVHHILIIIDQGGEGFGW